MNRPPVITQEALANINCSSAVRDAWNTVVELVLNPTFAILLLPLHQLPPPDQITISVPTFSRVYSALFSAFLVERDPPIALLYAKTLQDFMESQLKPLMQTAHTSAQNLLTEFVVRWRYVQHVSKVQGRVFLYHDRLKVRQFPQGLQKLCIDAYRGSAYMPIRAWLLQAIRECCGHPELSSLVSEARLTMQELDVGHSDFELAMKCHEVSMDDFMAAMASLQIQ